MQGKAAASMLAAASAQQPVVLLGPSPTLEPHGCTGSSLARSRFSRPCRLALSCSTPATTTTTTTYWSGASPNPTLCCLLWIAFRDVARSAVNTPHQVRAKSMYEPRHTLAQRAQTAEVSSSLWFSGLGSLPDRNWISQVRIPGRIIVHRFCAPMAVDRARLVRARALHCLAHNVYLARSSGCTQTRVGLLLCVEAALIIRCRLVHELTGT